jgi:hypothetical protein
MAAADSNTVASAAPDAVRGTANQTMATANADTAVSVATDAVTAHSAASPENIVPSISTDPALTAA